MPATGATAQDMTSRVPHMTGIGVFIGTVTIGMMNRARHRPVMYQPWLHLICGVAGAYFGAQLGQFYDDTGRTLSKQASGFASLPTWVYAQLSPTELDAELRDQRLAEARRKFDQLAAIEEAEFKARVEAGEVQTSLTKLQ